MALVTCAIALTLTTSPSTGANALVEPQVVDRAAEAGMDVGPTDTWAGCKGDWNGDGREDVAITRHMKSEGALFTQDGAGAFNRRLAGIIMPKVVRRTSTPQIPKHSGVDRHGCAMVDIDNDNDMDMYTSAGRYASNRLKHSEIDNELWIQGSDGSVVDMAIAYGVNEPCQRSRGVITPDLTGDGYPEVIIGAQFERNDPDDCDSLANHTYLEQAHVYLNKGDAGRDGVWDGLRLAPEFNVSAKNFGAAMLLEWDQDRDGDPDVLALSFPDNKPLLMRNNAGSSFTEVSQTAGIKLPKMNYASVGDVTGDGRDDLVYIDNNGVYYRAATATGVSTVSVLIGTLPGNADGRHVALGDVDGDGDTDVYGQTTGTTGNPDDILYLNNGAGNGYTPMTVPSAAGISNDVVGITVGGLTQFVVTNGGNGEEKDLPPGPVQLIALVSGSSGS